MGLFSKHYTCPSCNYNIGTHDKICPNCEGKIPFELRAEMLDRELVNIKCLKCGCDKSFYSENSYYNMAYCAECGEETFYDDTGKIEIPEFVTVECPYCHSTNTKKISITSKVGSVALFGIFAAGKVAKEWHCNNCKSDF